MTREEKANLLNDLLEYEEKNDIGNLTRAERREFQQWVSKALEQKPMEKFESVKDHIFKLAGDYKCWDNRLTDDEALELCHILEQEPCEDCISREKALELAENSHRLAETMEDLAWLYENNLKALPSVQPKQKSVIHSKWERGYSFPDGEYWKCSHCNELIKVKIPMHYCNNCGARMDKE